MRSGQQQWQSPDSPMLDHLLTDSARADVNSILDWSYRHFGRVGWRRYNELILAAIADIRRFPDHPASKLHPKYGRGVRSWHLRLSRSHVPPEVGRVESPRHVLFYRVMRGVVVIGRLLHERMDLRRQLSPRVWRQ